MVQWQWWQERVRNIRSLLSALLLLPSPRQSCNAHLVIHRHYVSSTPGLHSVLMQSHFRGRRCRVQASKRSPADYSAQICIQFNGVRPLVMLHRICTNANAVVLLYHTVSLLERFLYRYVFLLDPGIPGVRSMRVQNPDPGCLSVSELCADLTLLDAGGGAANAPPLILLRFPEKK